MAKNNQQNTGASQTNSFIKGLNKDSDPLFVQEGMWTHARNAVNNTAEGDVGTLSNEESNSLCAQAGTTLGIYNKYIIGAIHLFSDKWIIYTVSYDSQNTKPTNSEIGLFEGDICRYRPILQDTCLNFNKLNLITGASKLREDCTWQIYWADNLNPDRYINIGDPKTWPPNNYTWIGGSTSGANANLYSDGNGNTTYWSNIPWIEECKQLPGGTPTDCNICLPIKPLQLNCEAIRLATLVRTPCLDINVSSQQGVIENGSYAVVAAYVLNRQRVTNYFSNSYIQPVFNFVNEKGAFEITVDADSEHFEEFELVVIRFIDQNLSAKRVGYYSTRTTKIVIDQLRETAETVPVETILLQNPVFEKSEQIVEVNNYLLRVGPTSRFDFNYQPLANLIKANWVCVEYPETYYNDGGKNTSYLRDEVYSFFIRWVYNTGDKSSSYHIPGRPPSTFNFNGTVYGDLDLYSNVTGVTLPGDDKFFQSINTATTSSTVTSSLPDGGVVVGRGPMGYWQSTEKYPDFQADVWNSSAHCWTNTNDPNYDLCGKPIRHHKFPDNSVNGLCYHFQQKSTGFYIKLMGVEFTNIILPKDNDGNDIPGIVGYEILRGSRHGNKSILAKGMINNFRTYRLRGSSDDQGIIGLYANYPFNCIVPQQNNLSNAGNFNYQYNDPFITVRNNNDNKVNQDIPRDIISFHSPDTSFINPYLSTTEIKMYGYLEGDADQRFIEPNKHPEFKLLTNKIILFALVNGIIEALLNGVGQLKINYPAGNFTQPYGLAWTLAGGPPIVGNSTTGQPMNNLGVIAGNSAASGLTAALATYTPIADLFTPGDTLAGYFQTAQSTISGGSNTFTLPTYEKAYTGKQMLGGIINGFLSTLVAGGDLWYYFIKGTQDAVNTLYSIAKKRQYALEQISYGEYTKFRPANKTKDLRYIMTNGQYVYDQSQFLPEFTNSSGNNVKYRINNIKRPKLVVLRTERSNGDTDGPYYLLNPNGTSIDQSSMTLGHAIRTYNSLAMIPLGSNFTPGKVNWNPKGKLLDFSNKIASHYVGIKYRIENQYGQLDSVQQIVATPCEQKLDFDTTIGPNGIAPFTYPGVCNNPNFKHNITSSPVIFGGDTYINRFTEKNIMHMFYNWLYDVPDNIEYNYFLNQMIPEPRFQANSQPWDISDFTLNPLNFITNLFSSVPDYGEGALPSNYYDLDNVNYDLATNGYFPLGYPGFLSVRNSYFYTSINGIRDFFVESEVLVDFRDIGTFKWERPYSKYNYTDLPSLFDSNPEIITKGNNYAYDYTLSASRFLFNQYFTAGYLQGVTYDPQVAELCYTSYPNRIMYSLKQQEDQITDGWLTYLPLNKVDFKSKLSSVKNFAKTGMFITFENDSPLFYQGTDTLQLDDSGTAVTVGDASLFSRDPQNIVVAEKPYEYGSSQNRYGVVSTPAGLYYISQNQGKIFSYRQGLEEISQTGMKWWFNEFLPYKLLEDFPDYPHFDNPVAGISCMASYDNDNSILYFSKRDFKLMDKYKGLVTYDDVKDNFLVQTENSGVTTIIKVKIGDPRYFEDASWTISYDPKMQFWISFHDWHPNFYVPSKGSFFTTKNNGIWKHSAFCNDYCNFYGVQHPFEVELPVVTAQMVNTIKSIEYYLESYRRDRNLCVDQFHVLDYNFDQAIVFNSEQTSGYLNLKLYPKNDIPLSLQFPKLGTNLTSYDILYAKEEHKYRINQFWDITKDRGEFPIGSSYPPPQGPYFPNPDPTVLLGNYEEYNVWVTSVNGYVKILNPLNLDYAKPQLERKKFRHYINFIKLIKNNSRDTNMILKIVNTKTQYSPR